MMIRALVLVPTLPYPPRSGGDLRAWSLLRHLSAHLRITVAGRSLLPVEARPARALAELQIGLVSQVIPPPGLLVKVIKGLTFFFRALPVTAAGWYFRSMQKSLQEIIRREPFDFIIMESSWLGVYWPVVRSSPARKILDLYDLMGERLERQAALLGPGPTRMLLRRDARAMTRLEKRLIAGSDLILVTSERERSALAADYPRARVRVAPNGVDTEAISPLPPVASREILFVGSLNYHPNVDAVLYFAREVFPALRQSFPDLVFTVVGRSPPAELRNLPGTPGIQLAGDVEHVEPYYRRSAVCVAPLRAGGGTRLKILEALAYGRPVVSTRQGCEGLDLEPGKHLLLAEDPRSFIDQVSALLNRPELAAQLARQGRMLVEQKYAWKRIADEVFMEMSRLLEEGKA